MKTELMNKLIKANMLTITGNQVTVAPDSRWRFTSYPLEGRETVNISPEAYLGFLLRQYQFTEDLKSVEDFNVEDYANAQKQLTEKDAAKSRMQMLESQLAIMKAKAAELE